MKLTIILLTAAIVQVSAKGLSQTVSFNGKNAPLQEVLSIVKKQTGFAVIYSTGLLNEANLVSLNVKDMPLADFLELVFKDQPLGYSIKNTTIGVFRKLAVSNGAGNVVGINAILPPTLIRGRVLDADGASLAGATVTLKKDGKVLGVTNAEGVFSVSVSVGDVLVISSVGFDATEYKITSAIVTSSDQQSTPGTGVPLTITLKRKESQLDEVQIIAYGTTTKRLSTGNVTTVKAEDIAKSPVSNVLAAIAGRVPGMFITQNTGMPGGSFTVQIRGKNSLANGTDPLYIIDGVPYISQLLGNVNPAGGGNPLNFINIADIESISILKDAAETAIYGSRAANGAVLITTKKSSAGKTKLEVNIYSGVGKAPLRMDWLNTPQYLQMRHKAFDDDGETPATYNAPDLLVWDTTRYTDWQKLLIGGKAHYTDAQTNLSGGTQYLQYLFGIGYHKESTVFPFDGADQKVSAHFNIINTSLNKKFQLLLSGNYLQDNSNLPSTDLTTYLYTPPVSPPIYNPDGTLNWANSTWFNPLVTTLQKYKARTNNLVGNAVLSYQLFKNLEIKSSFGYTNMEIDEIQTTPIASQNPLWSPQGVSVFTNNGTSSWIIEPQANYKINFGQHHIEALLGTTFQSSKTNGQIIYALGYTSDAMLENIQAASSLLVNSVTSIDYKYNAIFGRLHYDYGSKWLLNLTLRRDGSSRFGAKNRFNTFSSAGAAWVFSKENFIKNIPFLSFGKLRASYGTTGNDQIGDYRFYNLYGTTATSYQGITGLIPLRLPNQTLAWEDTRKAEIGLDLGFIKDRFLIGASYYLNRSSNQLVFYKLPALVGFTSITANLPATIQNNGFEFSITTTNFQSKHFKWTSFLNLSIPRNRLLSYPDLSKSTYKNFFIIGQPITINRGFHFIGVNDTTGVYQFSNNKGEPTYFPSFLDDMTSVVNTEPKYYGAIENNFQYKDFTLGFTFQFRKRIGVNPLLQIGPPGFGVNYPAGILSDPMQQRYTQTLGSAYTAFTYAQYSDFNYTDASYIRLSNVSIGYTLPDPLIRKMHLRNFRVYLQGQNLLTLTKYKGMDPENQLLTALPPLRVITAGIQFSL